MTIAEQIAYCRANIALAEQELRAGNPDVLSIVRGLTDWSRELDWWQAEAERQGA